MISTADDGEKPVRKRENVFAVRRLRVGNEMYKRTRDFFLVLLVITAFLSMFPIIAFAQTENRVVHVLYPSDCPVELRSLRVAERSIEPQKTFEAGEDWLRYLSWELKNTWQKSAIYVEVDLDFHGLSRLESVFKYRYGHEPNTSGVIDETKLLRPGQTIRIIISDVEYERIKEFIAEKQPGFSTSVVELKVAKVVFKDGTIWPRRQKSESYK